MKTQKRRIKRDKVNPTDFMKKQLVYACEHCSFYMTETESCNLGLNTKNHRLSRQNKTYNMGGEMAFCRFLEID